MGDPLHLQPFRLWGEATQGQRGLEMTDFVYEVTVDARGGCGGGWLGHPIPTLGHPASGTWEIPFIYSRSASGVKQHKGKGVLK